MEKENALDLDSYKISGILVVILASEKPGHDFLSNKIFKTVIR